MSIAIKKAFLSKLDNTNMIIICIIPFALISPFLSDLFVVLSSILFLVSFFLRKDYSYLNNFFFKFLLFIYFYLLVLSLISDHIYNSLTATLFYFRYILFVFSVFYILQISKKFLYYLAIVLTITIFIFSIDGIIQYYFEYNMLGWKNQFPMNELGGPGAPRRISGLFGDELILGSFISRFLPLSLGLIFYFNFDNNRFKNIYLIIIYLSIGSLAIILTGERVAFFNLIVLFLFFSIFIYLINKKIFFSFIFLIVLFFIFIMSNNKVSHRLINETLFGMGFSVQVEDKEQFSNIDNNFVIFTPHHTSHYISAYKMYYQNPFFGVGPKNFRIKCKEPEYFVEHACSTHPHNTYLQLLSETGTFFAFLIFVLFFLCPIYLLIKSFIKLTSFRSNILIFKYFLTISIIINYMPLIPSGNFFNNWISIVYFFPIGFLFYILKKEN